MSLLSLKSLKKGFIWTTLSAVINIFSNFILIVTIATIWSPSDVGIFSIALFFIGLISLITPLGNDIEIIHHVKISKLVFWKLFTRSLLLLCAGVCITLVFGDYITNLNSSFSKILMLNILLIGASEGLLILVSAMLQRNLQLSLLEKVHSLKMIVTLLLSLVTIYFGFGVEALLSCRLIMSSFTLLGMLSIISFDKQTTHIAEKKDFFRRSGLNILAKNLVNYFSKNAELSIITFSLGVSATGYYDLGRRIVGQPRDLLAVIAYKFCFPIAGKIVTRGNEGIERKAIINLFKLAVAIISIIGFPVFTLIVIFAPTLPPLLLGQEWVKIVPIIQIFGVTATIQILGNGIVSAFLTVLGQSSIILFVELFFLPVRLLSVLLACPFGLEAVALTTSFFLLSKLIVLYLVLLRLLGISIFDFLSLVFPSISSTLISGIVAAMISQLVASNIVQWSFVMCFTFIATYIVATVVNAERIKVLIGNYQTVLVSKNGS